MRPASVFVSLARTTVRQVTPSASEVFTGPSRLTSSRSEAST